LGNAIVIPKFTVACDAIRRSSSIRVNLTTANLTGAYLFLELSRAHGLNQIDSANGDEDTKLSPGIRMRMME
jgi:hypothetical protein